MQNQGKRQKTTCVDRVYAYGIYDLTLIKENGLPRLHDYVRFRLIKHNRLKNVHVNALNDDNGFYLLLTQHDTHMQCRQVSAIK